MSTIKVDNLQTSGGVDRFTVSAWACFNGTGTPSIRADGNCSSITDHGTGQYSLNFSNSLTDANFCQSGSAGTTSTDTSTLRGYETIDASRSTSSMRGHYQNGINTSRFDKDGCSMFAIR